jgi:hypothetical protein
VGRREERAAPEEVKTERAIAAAAERAERERERDG